MADLSQNPSGVRSVQEGLRVSRTSLGWTMCAGTLAIGLGIAGDSLVLVAFGAIGLLDAAGSSSLIVHFRHSLRHEVMSERHEKSALRIITLGMAAVGIATIADSAYRLTAHTTSDAVPLGIALTGVSVLVLTILARRKRSIAQRIPSHALHADGWLSAMGAVLALVALAGTGFDAAFGWWWIDPAAASCVGGGAIGLGTALARGGDLR